jgi:hypothetical protein
MRAVRILERIITAMQSAYAAIEKLSHCAQ